MVLPTALKGTAASDVRSMPASVPCVARLQTSCEPVDDSSVVSGRLPESVLPKILAYLLLPFKNQ